MKKLYFRNRGILFKEYDRITNERIPSVTQGCSAACICRQKLDYTRQTLLGSRLRTNQRANIAIGPDSGEKVWRYYMHRPLPDGEHLQSQCLHILMP